MTKNISIAKIKNNLSEYISRVAYTHEKFIITKRDKPIAALINIEDFNLIQTTKESNGLISAIGKWEKFDEITEDINKIYASRKVDRGRDVSI